MDISSRLRSEDKQWCPPQLDVWKINFDGAFLESEKTGAFGVLWLDHCGHAVLAGAGRLETVKDVLSAEAQACLAALTTASDQGIQRISLESDSQVLVRALQSGEYDQALGGVLFREAKFLMSMQFDLVSITYAPQSCNRCAHDLARMDLSGRQIISL
ncbi:hypothetical protein C2845_PM02G18930 [Panicum miliaceum]|uniref:RNase H type-1 domain-containing protein n=1 Tax=Panicum miliaceum TaxID=4540 RepID=A0A3L6SES8_PANMI|nr:hypothetical protein C2845_PM02G18930 [Panicum miliaceum]